MSYVINPNTNRSIRVGGSAYRKLMRHQLVQAQQQDENDLEELDESDSTAHALSQHPMNSGLDPYASLQYVQVKQKKKKIGKPASSSPNIKKKRKKRVASSQELVSAYTSKCATRAFQNNLGEIVDGYSECESESDMVQLQNHLQKLILNEMMKTNKISPEESLEKMQSSVLSSKNIVQKHSPVYELETENEEDDDDQF